MGPFRRMGEKVKQALGWKAAGTDGHEWVPTSNARNTAMLKEASKFAQQIKSLHKEIKDLTKSIDGGVATMKTVLQTPLPKAFDVQDGAVKETAGNTVVVGEFVNLDAMTAATTELKTRMETEVLHPIEQWLAAYRTIKDRNKKCEELRLDLDSKRRTAQQYAERVNKMKSLPEDKVKGLEAMVYKMETEEDKMNRVLARYREIECEVFNALLTLIRDTCVLREYAAASLMVMQRCLQLAGAAFDLERPFPMPSLPDAAVPEPVEMRAVTVTSGPTGSMSPPLKTGLTLNRTGETATSPERIAENPEQEATSKPAKPEVSMTPFASCESDIGHKRSLSKPPQWYEDAKKNAKAPVGYDSDEEDGRVAVPA